MSAAEGDCELIADLAPQRPALGKGQVVGCRPQISQGRLATVLTWSRSRTRRGSGKVSRLLLTVLDRGRPLAFRAPAHSGLAALQSPPPGPGPRPKHPSQGLRASPGRPSPGAPHRPPLAGSFRGGNRCAQMAISSAVPRARNSARSRWRSSGEASGPRIGLAGLASQPRSRRADLTAIEPPMRTADRIDLAKVGVVSSNAMARL